MEIQEIIQALEDSKKTLDQLTIQLANASKERNTKELEYNKKIQVEIEKARQEGIQATLIKDIVKSRLAELMFELNMAASKETFFNNRLKDERENSKILITLLRFTIFILNFLLSDQTPLQCLDTHYLNIHYYIHIVLLSYVSFLYCLH